MKYAKINMSRTFCTVRYLSLGVDLCPQGQEIIGNFDVAIVSSDMQWRAA